jgi:glycosyltransferase involved in cell wall biosynthesis
MGLGLPMVLSPMAAGAVARDGAEALVVDPYDAGRWREALARLGDDRALRERLGAAAARRADDFVWPAVGERRRRLLETAIQAGAGDRYGSGGLIDA